MSRYIVELSKETWVAEWKGMPPYTRLIEHAKKYRTKFWAKNMLRKIRKYRDCPNAIIIEV